MKIEILQTQQSFDMNQNAEKILNYYIKSESDICIFPELSTMGYLPKDLLFNQNFIQSCLNINHKIISSTKQRAIIFGTIIKDDNKIYNAAVVAQNGKVIGISTKHNLPDIGVFNEHRYFMSGKPSVVTINNIKFGILVCEDTWHQNSYTYIKDADVFCSINASPFEIFPDKKTKLEKRHDVVLQNASHYKKPFIYCNTVGFYNGILFDGQSFVMTSDGFSKMLPFQEDSSFFNLKLLLSEKHSIKQNITKERYDAIVFGIREFFRLINKDKAVIGLSGGADSALVTTLAVQALGVSNVECIFMPSKYTSKESREDAETLCNNLKIQLKTVQIQNLVDEYHRTLSLQGLALENIQARIRGTMLMAISNQSGSVLLTTGNKSEVATGYCTLYGDMCGAFNPIKDLYKTEVFEMMQYINQDGEIIPKNILTKEPTAELKENQKDSDSLPPYHILDDILRFIIEKQDKQSAVQIHGDALVERISIMLKNSEFKRWQSCPGIKLSSRSFEKDDWQFNL